MIAHCDADLCFPRSQTGICVDCPADYYSDAGKAACQECGDGFVLPVVDANSGARDHTRCDPCDAGQFEELANAEHVCKACPADWYDDGTDTTLTTCLPCGNGTVVDANPKTRCVPCAAGKFEHSATNVCEFCEDDHFSAGGATSCDICPAGWATNAVGPGQLRTTCTACVSGMHEHAFQCRSCPDGWVAEGFGEAVCHTCPVGTAASGKDECEECRAGKYGKAVGTGAQTTLFCSSCPDDYFTSAGGKPNCTFCHDGFITNQARTECNPCPAGQYEHTVANACRKCPLAWASPGGVPSCTACTEGRVTVNDQAACDDCAAGTHVVLPNRTRCEACPKGWAASRGSERCMQCPRGFMANDKAVIQCVECASGTFANGMGGTICEDCPQRGVSCVTDGIAQIEPDFWHVPHSYFLLTNKTEFYKCLEEGVCILNDDRTSVSCDVSEGSFGVLCGECMNATHPNLPDEAPHGFTRRGSACTACSSMGISAAWFLLSFLFVWASLVVNAANTRGDGESMSSAQMPKAM